MAKKLKVSDEVVADAMQVAKATQKPGQTKEQTKLIAQGIQKGIEEYKKRNKEKARALDKQKRKLNEKASSLTAQPSDDSVLTPEVIYQQSKLPWALLLLSWAGFIAYIYLAA